MPTPLPYILDAETVGNILLVGEGVDAPSFQVENRILAILPQGGGYAEYVTAMAQFCVPLPPHIDAASFSVCSLNTTLQPKSVVIF